MNATITIPAIVVGLLLVLIGLLIAIIWSIRRHRDPSWRSSATRRSTELMPSLAGLTQGTVSTATRVEVFENGAFFDVLIERDRGGHADRCTSRPSCGRRACSGGAWRMRSVERAPRRRARCACCSTRDGGKKMGEDVERADDATPAASSQLHHPKRWRNIGVLNERDHRKLVVLDGRVAFVGGHCIVDSWLGDARGRRARARSQRAPARAHRARVQAAFSENWVGETGELFVGDDVFPASWSARATSLIHVACVKPEGSAPAVKILHHSVICLARKRIWIQNPYFIPEPDAIDAFGQAVEARRRRARDDAVAERLGHARWCSTPAHRNFEKLLARGVRLFEYPTSLLHQKVMTVDGVWCAIGSSNFDDRSFETNDEITLGMRDAALATRLEEIFERDCKRVRRAEARDLASARRLAPSQGQRALPVQRVSVKREARRPGGAPPRASGSLLAPEHADDPKQHDGADQRDEQRADAEVALIDGPRYRASAPKEGRSRTRRRCRRQCSESFPACRSCP